MRQKLKMPKIMWSDNELLSIQPANSPLFSGTRARKKEKSVTKLSTYIYWDKMKKKNENTSE